VPPAAERLLERKIKHAAPVKLTIPWEKEMDFTCEFPLSDPCLLLLILGQAHGGVELLVDRLEFAMKLIHGAN
jgi:hypothetical protein